MSERPVPEWLLERLAHGDLPEDEAARLRARLAATSQTGALEDLARSNKELLAQHPPEVVAAEVRRRVQAAPAPVRRRAAWTFTLPTLALATAGMVALLVARPTTVEQAPEEDRILLKGQEPSLRLYRQSGDGNGGTRTTKDGRPAERLASGATLRPGDTVQFAYVAGGRTHGVIASVDARGTVTLHHPAAPGGAPRLMPDGEVTLPIAFELDDSPGFERFVFVTANGPFSTSVVLEALGKNGRPLPEGLSAIELTLRKETP